jgi:hypothetical protein
MSIKYYQEIVANDGTQERNELNKATLEALEAVLEKVEKEIEGKCSNWSNINLVYSIHVIKERKEELIQTKRDITELYDLTALTKMPVCIKPSTY